MRGSLIPMVLLLALPLIFNLFIRKKAQNLSIPNIVYPYKMKENLLSPAEKDFFDVLLLALKDTKYYICPKVRLVDVITVGKAENRQIHFNKIRTKKIDFLLCDRHSFTPLAAIELDYSEEKDKDDSYSFLEESFKAAGLYFVKFSSFKEYSIEEINERLNI